MGILQNITQRFAPTRSVEDLFQFYNQLNGGVEPHFLDTINSSGSFTYTDSTVLGLTDNQVSPRDIHDMVYRDTYFSALFESLIEAVFKNDLYIKVKKDKDGNLLGSEKQAKILEKMLKKIDYETLITQQLYAEFGDGGGNALLFTIKGNKGVEFKVEPFIENGLARVKVYADNRTKKIYKYEVIDSTQSAIYTIDPQVNYYKHSRYSRGGDFRFSNNPAKRAVYWFVLKKYLAGSNLSAFKNGLQDVVLASPDYSALTDLVNAMGGNKVSGDAKADYLSDPIKFLAKQSQLDDEILRTIVGKAKKNNTLIKLKMPYKYQNAGRNNRDMETKELIRLCDEQMGYALRTSKGIVNTMDSKYSNAEIESDNWNNLVLDPTKRRIEKTLQEFYLPALEPLYNSDIYEVCFGRDPDAEDIEVYNAKTARNKSTSEILVALSTVPGYKYNLHTQEIEETSDTSTLVEEQSQSIVDDNQNEEARTVDQLENYWLYKHVHSQTRQTFEERRDEAYKKYHESVNMSRSELESWANTECSTKASLDRAPIRRNLELLDTKKADWTSKHVSWALKTVGFIARMRQNLGGQNIVKDSNGKSCGTKAYISLKNWAFNPDKRGQAVDYKTEMLRAAKKSPTELALATPEAAKFEKIIQNALKKQVESYIAKLATYSDVETAIANLEKDLTPITQNGLTVNTLKQQELKFAKMGIEDFEKKRQVIDGFNYPDIIINLIDAKSQVLLKGYDSLNQEQKSLLSKYYGDYSDYMGMDAYTSSWINTVLNEGLKNSQTITEIVENLKKIAEERYANQAKRIANTEIAQAVEATRYAMYDDAGYNEKKWIDVNDSRVRPWHQGYSALGWIPIDQDFISGSHTAKSPASEIDCRCTVIYQKLEN